MKYAAAMKYGGELVDAIECDYNSFKQLVPLCPNCKEPVYLRASGDRVSSKGKRYKVGAHWCHFKGISEEQVASCESRVNNYSEKDKQRISAKARGQRLKLLQRWFWNIAIRFANDNYGSDCDFLSVLSENLLKIGKGNFYFIQNNDLAFHAYQSWFSKVFQERTYEESIWHVINNSKLYVKEFFPAIIEDFYNQKISLEVLGFLAHNSSRDVFSKIYESIPEALHVAAKYRGYETDDDGYEDLLSEWLQGVLLFIFSIPWVSEFQRLESEVKQKNN